MKIYNINEETKKTIIRDLKTRYIYNSNAIEGNTLTLNETKVIIEEGLTVPNKKLNEHLEAYNHEKALNFILDIAKEEKTSLAVVREVHKILMQHDNTQKAGEFRKHKVKISGSSSDTENPLFIEKKLKQIIDEYINSDSKLVQKVAKFHADFEHIHPFSDGNGRTGRLIMNLQLMAEGCPITIINQNSKAKYYDALDIACSSGNYKNLEEYIQERVDETLKIYEKYSEQTATNMKIRKHR